MEARVSRTHTVEYSIPRPSDAGKKRILFFGDFVLVTSAYLSIIIRLGGDDQLSQHLPGDFHFPAVLREPHLFDLYNLEYRSNRSRISQVSRAMVAGVLMAIAFFFPAGKLGGEFLIR
jgi:hypothetical protein